MSTLSVNIRADISSLWYELFRASLGVELTHCRRVRRRLGLPLLRVTNVTYLDGIDLEDEDDDPDMDTEL